MNNDKKKINKNIKNIFYLLVIIFMSLYIAGQTGYYERKNNYKTQLTKEAIIKFEKDISEGKEVDIKDYISTNNNKFNNKYSNLGMTLSNSVDYIFNHGLDWILKIIKTLFS